MTDTNPVQPAFTAPVPQGQAQAQIGQPTSSDGTQNTDSNQGSVPYSRFQKVIQSRKELENKLKGFEDAEAKRAEEEAIKKGEFDTVLAQLRPKAERADALEASLKEYLEAELADVPAQFKDLLPTGDITTQLAWIKQAKAKGLFNRVQAPNTDAGAVGDPKPQTKLTDEQRTLARQFGMSDDEYSKHIWDGKRSF